jgi:hypothetical protein
MRILLIVTASVVALSFSIALAQTHSTNLSPSGAGIEGTIEISPTHGGPIREDIPDSKPLASIQFTVQREGESTPVASFTTDQQGHFRVSLPPGRYNVTREGGKRGIGKFGPFAVEVAAGKMTLVQWHCDSGMR